MGAPSEDSSQSWNLSGTSSPFKEVLNEGGDDSMMSTPNMSFDSPIVVTKSNFGVDKQKDTSTNTEPASNTDTQDDPKETKLEEDKRTKKKDMFAPEADMFAEEYSVSYPFDYLFECAHVQVSHFISIIKFCENFSSLHYLPDYDSVRKMLMLMALRLS